MNYDNNKNFNNRLVTSMQLINVFIGAIIALICVVAYITIDSMYIRGTIIIGIIICGIVFFINLHNKLNQKEVIADESSIKTIELVNENNEVVKKWNIEGKISFIIGKSTLNEKVFIDLNSSIYSTEIENNHAVLNYAAGKWYIEDLSSEGSVSVQKADDSTKYRIVKDAPCELKKGDIIFISKVKLLIR